MVIMLTITSEFIDDLVYKRDEEVIDSLQKLGEHIIDLGMFIRYIESSTQTDITNKKELKEWIYSLLGKYSS
jgi:hypothetical protein